MRRLGSLVLGCWLMLGQAAWAEEPAGTQRIDSRFCTIWLHPELTVKQVNKRVSTWRVRPRVKTPEGSGEAGQLQAKCDTLFRRAQEILDMYPAGIHTTIRVVKDQDEIRGLHQERFGYGTKAVAFYVRENNTIYVAVKDLSESVLIHEMAHAIINHYFPVRPPRKIEELLAIHVDSELRQ